MSETTIQPAHHIKLAVCPDHGELTLVLFDEHEQMIGIAHIPVEGISPFIDDILEQMEGYVDGQTKN